MATTTERGYGRQYQLLRERYKPVVEGGEAVCARCGRLILPGTPWHLDHRDSADRLRHAEEDYLGPSHRRCNIAQVSKRRARRNRARYWSVEW